jgi:hypothetical protein
MKISFPHGPSLLYIYLAVLHILWLPQAAVLAKGSPNTATGCTYTLTLHCGFMYTICLVFKCPVCSFIYNIYSAASFISLPFS